MVVQCRSQLSIRPNSARAVLFYSQKPNGERDDQSLHGGCPVIRGEKWAANLWVWNTPRQGYPGSPMNEFHKNFAQKSNVQQQQQEVEEHSIPQKKASFRNSGKNPAYARANLYYETTFWDKLRPGAAAIWVNTY